MHKLRERDGLHPFHRNARGVQKGLRRKICPTSERPARSKEFSQASDRSPRRWPPFCTSSSAFPTTSCRRSSRRSGGRGESLGRGATPQRRIPLSLEGERTPRTRRERVLRSGAPVPALYRHSRVGGNDAPPTPCRERRRGVEYAIATAWMSSSAPPCSAWTRVAQHREGLAPSCRLASDRSAVASTFSRARQEGSSRYAPPAPSRPRRRRDAYAPRPRRVLFRDADSSAPAPYAMLPRGRFALRRLETP